MPLGELSFETLQQVRDGAVRWLFNRQLQQIIADIESAPDIDKAREVNLKVKATPVCEGQALVDVDVEFIVTGKRPERVTSSRMRIKPSKDGKQRVLKFEIDTNDVNQPSLLPDSDDDDNK